MRSDFNYFCLHKKVHIDCVEVLIISFIRKIIYKSNEIVPPNIILIKIPLGKDL